MSSVSKSQQRLFGQVHKCQKTGNCSSEKVKKIASHISKKDAEDFARTKHKGLPDKVKKKNRFKSFKEHLQNLEEDFAGQMERTPVRAPVQRRVDFLNQGVSGEKNVNRQMKVVWDVMLNSNLPPDRVMRMARNYASQYQGRQGV